MAVAACFLALGALTTGELLMSAEHFVEARAAYKRAVKFALTTSERQALVASVNLVELDIASGNTADALQLATPAGAQFAAPGASRDALRTAVSHVQRAPHLRRTPRGALNRQRTLRSGASIGCQQTLHGPRCDGIARLRGRQLRGSGADCRLLRCCSWGAWPDTATSGGRQSPDLSVRDSRCTFEPVVVSGISEWS